MAINNFPLFVGLRYLRGKRSNRFASVVSLFSFGAMALGVLALITVLSVMNGFNREIRDRLLNVIPHAVIMLPIDHQEWQPLAEQLRGHKEITSVAPLVDGYGLLTVSGRNRGVMVQGIAPELEADLQQHMQVGELQQLREGEFGIVLGSLLARSLAVAPGMEVMLSLPSLNVTPAGIFPRFKRLRVVGIFQVGAQVDDGMAFIHYRDAQKIYRTGRAIKGLRLRVSDPLRVEEVTTQLRDELPVAARTVGWGQQLGSLFQAIKTEKVVVGILLSAIIAVAAFNIIASLVLLVTEKRKAIAVLKTQGAEALAIFKIFMIQGSAIGCAGVLVGVVLGCLLAFYIGDIVLLLENLFGFYVFDPEVYFISKLPSQLLWLDVAIIAGLGLLLSFLATIYPAFRAGQVLPAEALRYDH